LVRDGWGARACARNWRRSIFSPRLIDWDRVSLGAGLDIQYVSPRLSQAIDFGLAAQPPLSQFFAALPPFLVGPTQAAYRNAGFFPGGLDGVSEETGNDWSLGFALGALVEYCKGSDQSFSRWPLRWLSVGHRPDRGRAETRGAARSPAAGTPVRLRARPFSRSFFDQNATARLNLPAILHFSRSASIISLR
jgi:long-subunit fatty acid transport protein